MAILVSCMAIGWMPEKAQAAAAPGSGIHYLDDQYAKAMIGFIYDKSKLTDVEMNAGGMYTFLTGGYPEGSPEEIAARIIFLTVAKANISQCMSKYDTVMDNSYNQLLNVLTEIAGGDIDDGLANNTLDDIADGIAAGFMLIGDVDDDILDLVDTAKAGYQNTKSLTEKVKQMRQGVETAVSGFFYIWSGSRKNMYTYVDQYVRNRPMKDSCPAAFDTMMAYNVSALKSSMLGFDPILNWASKDHLAVLNTFGDFIYEVEQSLANPASYSQTYKTYQVHCPTDVYLYREDGTLTVSIL
jgi:hypothetical protein